MCVRACVGVMYLIIKVIVELNFSVWLYITNCIRRIFKLKEIQEEVKIGAILFIDYKYGVIYVLSHL